MFHNTLLFPVSSKHFSSRRRFLATAVTLACSIAVLSGCGGSDDNGLPTDLLTPTPTPIVLPEEYAFSYNVAESRQTRQVVVYPDGDVFTMNYVGGETDTTRVGISRYTNAGKPDASLKTTVLSTSQLPFSSVARFAVSPSKEIYVPNYTFDTSAPSSRVAVLSVSGEVVRTVNIESAPLGGLGNATFSASGDLYIEDENGIRRYDSDGRLKNTVLTYGEDVEGVSEVNYARPAILPGDVVWSATYLGFEVANADGSNRRTVSAEVRYNQLEPRVTRTDGEGNLYIDALLPRDYPNPRFSNVPVDIDLRPFVIKFAPDGTQLAAILTQNTNTLKDFDVDQAGNVYVASEEQVSVYGRIR